MFAWRADVFLAELAQKSPDLAEALHRAVAARREGDESSFAAHFSACPNISVDYAVLEKSNDVASIPVDAGWTDLGSWESLALQIEPDGEGNRLSGETLVLDCRDTFVAGLDRPVATLGLQGLVVVAAGGAILVCPRSRVQEVRRIVAALEAGTWAPFGGIQR